MDGPGFHVDIDVLEAAAGKMSDIVAEQENAELRDLCGAPELYGNDGVHAELSEFCRAWSVGLDALGDRAGSMAGDLRDAAHTYREADVTAGQALTQDPAADVVDPPHFESRGHP